MHFPRFGLPKIARRKVAMSGGSLLSHRVDRRSQLALEPLEDRLLLSVSFSPGPYLVPVNNVDRAEGTIGTNATPIEPQVAIDPVHPSTLALSQQDGLQLSTDAGATFSRPITYPQIQTGPVVNKGDTTTVFDSHGRLFWANLSDVTGILTVYVTQLDPTTGAPIPRATHAVSTPPAASMSYDDKDFLAVDSHDNLYVAWTRFSGCSDPGAANPLDCSATTVMISRSTDQGQTWSPPVTVSDPADGFTWPATVSIATSGDVYVAYHATPATSFAALNDANGEVVVARYSNDLGTLRSKTAAFTPGNAAIRGLFSPSGVFSQTYPGTDFFTAGTGQSPVLTDPARPRNVYVISVNDPSAGGPGDPADLVFARSTDRGAHWRTSTLEDGPNGSFQLFPTASIDQFGDIVVAWYDNRAGLKDGAGNYLLDVYAKYSTDGGLTWSPAFQVNDLNNHFNTQNIPPDPQLGIPRIADYIGTSLFGGTAYVTWEGNRGAHDQQVFLDSFALRGSLTVSGDKGALDDTGIPQMTVQPIE